MMTTYRACAELQQFLSISTDPCMSPKRYGPCPKCSKRGVYARAGEWSFSECFPQVQVKCRYCLSSIDIPPDAWVGSGSRPIHEAIEMLVRPD